MGVLFERGNDALLVTPPVGDTYALSHNGSDWLWAVTAIYAVCLLVVVGLAYFARVGEKVFHYLFTISLLTGTIAYFTIASDLGSVPVVVSATLSSPGTREIFYAKYINWFVGWTPLVIAVGLISGVSWTTIVYNVALMWTWIATWLAGALVATTYKWGFFVFGFFAYLLLSVSLLYTGLVGARRVNISRHYLAITGYLEFLWLLYAIAYGLDDGGNKITVTHGFVFFGILDIFTVPILSFVFLALSTRWDYGVMNLHFTQYGRVAQGAPMMEKAAPAAAAPVVENV